MNEPRYYKAEDYERSRRERLSLYFMHLKNAYSNLLRAIRTIPDENGIRSIECPEEQAQWSVVMINYSTPKVELGSEVRA